MKLIGLFAILFFMNTGIISQRVIYSRPVRVDIPAKEQAKDTINKFAKIEETRISKSNFELLIDSLSRNKENTKTRVDLKIDTISENNQQFQQFHFTFRPDWGTDSGISDYPSGAYLLESSTVSLKLSKLVKETLTVKILPYAENNEIIIIKIKGTADATSIKGLKYQNEFGIEIRQKYNYDNVEYESIINSKKMITTNRELAFLRTYGIRNFIEKNLPELQQKAITFTHFVDVYENIGEDYRKVSIEVLIRKKIL